MPFQSAATDTPEPAPAPSIPGARRLCVWIQQIAVVVGLAIGGSNLAVWIGGAEVARLALDLVVMRLNTAIGITLASLSLALWLGPPPNRVLTRLATLFASITMLIGALTAAQDILGIDLHIDQLFVPGAPPWDVGAAYSSHPGRMSLNAAATLFFLGLGLMTIDWCVQIRGRKICPAPGFAIIALLPTTLALVGYLEGTSTFTGLLESTNILLHTAWALFALCIGVLASRPDLPPMRRILSTAADGVLLRWTLPGTLGLLILGWVIANLRRAGDLNPGEGIALMLYGGLVLLFFLLNTASRAIARQEASARRASAALRIGQERSRAIFDTALDAVIVMDAAGEIAGWNPAAERIFGWSRADALGQPLAERIIPPRLREAHRKGLARLLEVGAGQSLGRRLEFEAMGRDGHEFPVELSITALPGTARTLFVGFARDITDRRSAEENLKAAKDAAESASRAKDNFLATLSHELRTPLAPVLLSATALRQEESLPAEVRRQMAMIERNIGLEARLIDDLLDLTRIARGKLPLHLEPCDAHSLMSHAVEIVRDDAAERRVTIHLDLAARHSGVTGDAARLQQVFWNLLKNAVKFTPPGGRIEVHTRDGNAGDRLIVEVTDNGLGFAPGAAEHIFEPFEQAGREGDHRFGGLGLGLSIARAIVDLHSGVIRAHSEGPGRGATFCVELPGATDPPHGVSGEMNRPGAIIKATAPLRLLVVEDHEPTLEVLVRLLTRAGHTVLAAGSVAEATALVERNGIDVVISDLGLPDGTGLELMSRLRVHSPQLRGIALTGYGMEEDLLRSRAAGFGAHLVKPIDFDQLRKALADLQAGPP